MSRSRGTGALLPPSPNPSRQGRGMRKPSPPAEEGRVTGRLRSEQGQDFEVRCRSRGFTIIELIVALAITGVLIAIAVPTGLRWRGDYRFSSAARSLSNAVLMARMRGIENRAVFTITASQATNNAPFSAACPGMLFTTNVDHGLSQPNPVLVNALVVPPGLPTPWNPKFSPVANCSCVKTLAAAPPPWPTSGDMVMFSGLNQTTSMNGVEFEVITVPAPNQFAVQAAAIPPPDGPDIGSTNNAGTVRNVSAPGRLRIVPAVHTLGPGPLTDNQENFGGTSAYTVKEEASSIVLRYDTNRFLVSFYLGNPVDPAPGGTLIDPPPGTLLDPAAAAKNFAEIRFDRHGIPRSTVVGNNVPTPATANITILIAEVKPYQPRWVQYVISTTGKVNTLKAD
jgi:prepilin-type N-terminal cleavage/methylation domain-containing protein